MLEGGHYVSDEKLVDNFNLGLENLDKIFLDADEVFVMENNEKLANLMLSFHIKRGKLIKYFSTPKSFNRERTSNLLKLIAAYNRKS